MVGNQDRSMKRSWLRHPGEQKRLNILTPETPSPAHLYRGYSPIHSSGVAIDLRKMNDRPLRDIKPLGDLLGIQETV
jgi:hypothetical protein